LGIGPNPQSPIPNPQSPIPKQLIQGIGKKALKIYTYKKKKEKLIYFIN
jgi:hypothetical protein